MTLEQFAAFIKSVSLNCPAQAKVGTWGEDASNSKKVMSLFDKLRGLAETLSRQRFINMVTKLVYCATQAGDLRAEQLSFAKVVHKMEEGELVEAVDAEVDGPSNTRQ